MADSLAIVFFGFVLRFAQALAEGAPTLLCGLLVAGIFRRMLTPAQTRRLFGGGGQGSLAQAWLLGMLLPVCALGIFPILREMRRVGLSAATILTFALAAPLFNPLSFLYGLTLTTPSAIFGFVLASLVLVGAVGLLWKRWDSPSEPPPEGEGPVEPGPKRLLAVAVYAAREIAGPTLGYVLLALTGVGLTAAILPHGCLQNTMNHHSFPEHPEPWLSPLLMTSIALPVYLSPMKAIGQVGLMFDHGNSVGAALVLMIVGTGMNLGLLFWIGRNYGVRRMALWSSLTLGTILVLAYAIESPLYPAGKIEENHTHAFDDYCRPFPVGTGDRAAFETWRIFLDRTAPHEWFGLVGLGLLLAAGVVLRKSDPGERLDRFLSAPNPRPGSAQTIWNRPLPGSFLAGCALLGLIGLSILGCYLYYPPPAVVLDDMNRLRADIHASLAAGHREETMRYLRRYDDLTRRLEIGVFLRSWKLDEASRKETENLRLALEEVFDHLQEGDVVLARQSYTRIHSLQKRVQEAFGPSETITSLPI